MATSTIKTTKFNIKLKELFGSQYKLISEYHNNKTKVTLLDTISNQEITVTPMSLFQNVKSHKQVSSITILDSIMGSGKSTYLSNHINSNSSQKYIIVLPLLSECHRFAQTVPTSDKEPTKPLTNGFGQVEVRQDNPNASCLLHMNFKHPQTSRQADGAKIHDLGRLLTAGHNIVCTHALFSSITDDLYPLLADYNLIIDEALNTFEEYEDIDKDTLGDDNQSWFTISKDNVITFNYQQFGVNIGFIKNHKEWIELSDSKRLLWSGASVILKGFDTKIFNYTKSNLLCTYQYKGSMLDFYLNLHTSLDINVTTLSTNMNPSTLKPLITIIQGEDMNSVGNTLLSNNALKKDKTLHEELNDNLEIFFAHTKPCDRLYTCFKRDIKHYNPKYLNQQLAFNTRATNEYADATRIAFLVDLYLSPELAHLNDGLSNKVDKDMYALNHMIQFIWRSAIRRGQPITLYIPSKRMRTLLLNWLDDQYVQTLPIIN